MSSLEPLITGLRQAAAEAARLEASLRGCLEECLRLESGTIPDGASDGDGADGATTIHLVGHSEPEEAVRGALGGPVAVRGFRVDAGRHTVEVGDRRAMLTPNEWQLFAVMLAEPGHIFTREALAVAAWGRGYGGRNSEVEVYISRLRRKLEADPRSPLIIETVRGTGYRLMAPEDELEPVPAEHASAS